MSGGQLVVLDRSGRDVKRFPLAEGLVTLGSDHSCDIRFMLDTVNPHHATVAVHANQTVVRNVSAGETLVNGRCVSVAALRHGDVIGVGGRQLRWDYADPAATRVQAPQPALYVSRRTARPARRGSGPAGAARRDPAARLALEMSHRASMPANAGGKQVAIVQPQRRDTNDQNDKPPPRSPAQGHKRARASRNELDMSVSDVEVENAKRKWSLRASATSPASDLHTTTKATLWIESRKPSRRSASASASACASASATKSTPLRLTVLKRAQSAQKMKVTKIEAPLKIDHTKQAAILLMTGHTPKSRLLGQKTPSPKSVPPKSVTPKSVTLKSVTPKSVPPKLVSPKSVGRRSASFVVKKKSPLPRRSTPRGRTGRTSDTTDRTVTILEITDSEGRNSTLRQSSRRSGQRSFEKSPLLPSPKKSALKNPLAKKSLRKTESIKFDLSNLENRSQESDAAMASDTRDSLSLRYSASPASPASPAPSPPSPPSPRRALHPRGARALQQLPAGSTRPSTSLRRSVVLQRALNDSDEGSRSSRAFRTRTLSPRPSRNDLESYSIVDLVSVDSNETGLSASVYDSAGSSDGTAFGTPRDGPGRRTRSTIDPTLLGSSTPYVKGTRSSTRSRSDPDVSIETSNNSARSTTGSGASRNKTWSNSTSRLSSNSSRLSGNSQLSNKTSNQSINKSSVSTRNTKSLSTPENATIPISVNSTKISRASRSRSRINDSDLLLIEPDDVDDSPRSSKRASAAAKRSSSAPQRSSKSSISTPIDSPAQENGINTPENTQSPEEASTPVLSIQSLLDSSQNSIWSQSARRGRATLKRKTIGGLTGPKTRVSTKSKSMNFSARRSRLRLSNDSYENMNVSEQNGENVTPKSAVKLVHEAVKNKHSTAKKTQSKRSMIDDLNDSDIVKQLFNSPVKRKLSQSMTEFSRKHLFDDDDVVQIKRPTRNTVALTGRTPDNSLLDNTEAFTPEQFVSPISTPSHSPNLAGIKRLFGKKTPENDLQDVRGVKALLRTPRARRSIRNDLTDVVGVKAVFAKSPKNRLSDVRVKEVFASSPKNDLRRVSGVKSLFQSRKKRKSPRNSLGDVRGVKKMFNRKSAVNDLRNVSGVKKALQKNSPNNDLRDVRGVKRLFGGEERNELSDMSGVEELFYESNTSHRDAESLFDQLVGKPTIKAVYSKSFTSRKVKKKTSPKSRSLVPIDVITENPEEWLEQKLQEIRNKRLQKDAETTSKSANKSKLNVTRELRKLATDTVAGSAPVRTTRVRHSTITRTSFVEVPRRQKSASELYSAHMLPIKKRSLANSSSDRPQKDKVVNLPIKKRVVVHSTPMKGRQVNMTMNASELGRVSPIVADKTRDLEHDLPSSNVNKDAIETKPKSRRATKALAPSTSIKLQKPTPRKTRGKSKVPTPIKSKPATPTKDKSPAKTKTPSPVKKPVSPKAKAASPRKTRSRRTVAVSPQAETNTKKRGATLVVAKKSPVMSPKASRKRKEPESLPTPKASPKRTRAARNKDEKEFEKAKTPKSTRVKVQRATVVVSKPSPQLKPRPTRGRAQQSASQVQNDTRKVDVKSKKLESPKKSPVQRKSAKNVTVEHVPKTRRRKNTVTNDESKQNSVQVEKTQPKSKRGRNTNATEPTVTRTTRKTDKQDAPVEEPKKARGKKVEKQESTQSEPTATTRSRRGNKPNTTAPEANTRKRKTTASDERPTKVSKYKEVESRGRSKKDESPKTDTVNVPKKTVGKASKQAKKPAGADAPKRGTRAKKAEVSVQVPSQPAQRSTRGKKSAVVEPAPETGKRKRKTTVESPPVEDARKKARATRSRAEPTPEAGKTAGRSRRR